MCGVGRGDLVTQWTHALASHVLALDTVDLDRRTPELLRDLHDKVQEREATPDETSTIYHFGWDPGAARFVAYRYRSANDFESEEYHGSGRSAMPDWTGPDGERYAPEFRQALAGMDTLEDMVHLARTIRRQHQALPHLERIHIGGQLILTELMYAGPRPLIATSTIEACEGYVDQLREVLAPKSE